MDLALNNLQRLICHKTQTTNQQTNQATINAKSCLSIYIEYTYDLQTHFVYKIHKQAWALFCTQLNGFKYCYITVTI